MMSNKKLKNEKNRIISYYEMVEDGEYRFIPDCYFNGFFRIEIATKKTELIGYFSENHRYQIGIVRKIILKENKLIIFPMLGKNIYIYNTKKGVFDCVTNECFVKDGHYAEVISIGNDYLMIPCDIRNELFLYYSYEKGFCPASMINENIKKKIRKKHMTMVDAYAPCVIDQVLYLPVLDQDIIFAICLNDYGIKEIKIKNASFRNAAVLGDNLWLTSFNKKSKVAYIICLDKNTHGYKKYTLPEVERMHSCYCFERYRDTLLAFEEEGDHIWIYDKISDVWKVFKYASEYPPEFHRVWEGYPLFFGFHHKEGKLLLLPTGGNGTIEIDEKTDEMTFYTSGLPEDYMEMRVQIERERRISLINKELHDHKDGMIFESNELDIDAYIGNIL